MQILGKVSDFMLQGGPFMWVIAFVAVVGMAVAFERFFFLFFRFNIDAGAFMNQIRNLVMNNHIDRAIKLCSQAQKAALPRVVKAGLQRANKGEAEIANAVEEAILEVLPEVTKRTDNLLTIAQVATYLGLLGTIFGMIAAFAAVATAPPEEKATALAGAISIAMNTTAFGLIVAIPSMAVHLFLKNITLKIVSEIDQYSVKLENLLVARSKGQLSSE